MPLPRKKDTYTSSPHHMLSCNSVCEKIFREIRRMVIRGVVCGGIPYGANISKNNLN